MAYRWIILLAAVLLSGCTQNHQINEVPMEKEISGKIIAMEKAALNRWGNGDPSGFLEISASDVVYFDPSLDRRLNGIDELKALYEGIRGKIHVDKYELIAPKVQLCGDIAILTFNYVGYSGEKISRWNCTEVYRNQKDRWEIVHTHWSFTKPNK